MDIYNDDEPQVCTAAPIHSIKDRPPDLGDDPPWIVRAQIDTGAFASVTSELEYLHNYKPFHKDFPSPLLLLPATVGSDTVPIGYGYLHLPVRAAPGYIAVRAFYSPELRTTVIDERDVFKASGGKIERFFWSNPSQRS